MGSNMQGDVVLVALDEVKAGSMPEEQKKAMVQGSPRTMPKSLSKR
nr:Peptidyl-prolyl cis-trans isomerase D [Klebsiella pneumoniae]